MLQQWAPVMRIEKGHLLFDYGPRGTYSARPRPLNGSGMASNEVLRRLTLQPLFVSV